MSFRIALLLSQNRTAAAVCAAVLTAFLLGTYLSQTDPLVRRPIRLNVPGQGVVSAWYLGPKEPKKFLPVLVHLRGQGSRFLTADGPVLKQFARFGFAGIALDHDPSSPDKAVEQLIALHKHLSEGPWAHNDRIVWIGSSYGARITGQALLNMPKTLDGPQLVVMLGSGPLQPSDRNSESNDVSSGIHSVSTNHRPTQVLMIQGGNDQLFPQSVILTNSALLTSRGFHVHELIVPGADHSLTGTRDALVARLAKIASAMCQALPARDEPQRSSLRWIWLGYTGLVAGVVLFFWLRRSVHRLVFGFLFLLAVSLVLWVASMSATPILVRFFKVKKAGPVPELQHLLRNSQRQDYTLFEVFSHLRLCRLAQNRVSLSPMDFREEILLPLFESDQTDLHSTIYFSVADLLVRESTRVGRAMAVLDYLNARIMVDEKGATGPLEEIWYSRHATPGGFAELCAFTLRCFGIPARVAGNSTTVLIKDSNGWVPVPERLARLHWTCAKDRCESLNF